MAEHLRTVRPSDQSGEGSASDEPDEADPNQTATDVP
jgi:hypothetical protein